MIDSEELDSHLIGIRDLVDYEIDHDEGGARSMVYEYAWKQVRETLTRLDKQLAALVPGFVPFHNLRQGRERQVTPMTQDEEVFNYLHPAQEEMNAMEACLEPYCGPNEFAILTGYCVRLRRALEHAWAEEEVEEEATPEVRPSALIQWEYNYERLHEPLDDMREFNTLGSHGWEMVTSTAGGVAWFKRPVRP